MPLDTTNLLGLLKIVNRNARIEVDNLFLEIWVSEQMYNPSKESETSLFLYWIAAQMLLYAISRRDSIICFHMRWIDSGYIMVVFSVQCSLLRLLSNRGFL